MALKRANRGVQRLLMSEFVANYNDTGVDAVTGATKGFGTTIAENLVMDSNLLPVGAVIDHGELVVETAGVGPTAYTVAVALSDGTVLLAATSILATGRTAFTGTGFPQSTAGVQVRITMASTVAVATAGKFRVRVFFTIDGKADEVITA
jgi:hypothetical protein